MIPKVTKTQSKILDSESKADDEEDKTSTNFEFSGKHKFLQSFLQLDGKRSKGSNSIQRKEKNLKTKRVKNKNSTKSSFKLNCESNEETDVSLRNEVSSNTSDINYNVEVENKKYKNKKQYHCDKTINTSSAIQKNIKVHSPKVKSNNITSDSDSSLENPSANFKRIRRKYSNDIDKKTEVDNNETKFKPKRRKIVINSDSSDSSSENQSAKLTKSDRKYSNNIDKKDEVDIDKIKCKPKSRKRKSSDSSCTSIEEKNTNSGNNFEVKDNETTSKNKLTNTKVETQPTKHNFEGNLNEELNSKFTSNNKDKTSEFDKIESVISESDSESIIIEDDEDWNYKHKKVKLQTSLNFNSSEEENYKSSEADSESIKSVKTNRISNKPSNSEHENLNNKVSSPSVKRKEPQNQIVNKQNKTLESDLIKAASSKISNCESKEVSTKDLRHKFYQEKSTTSSKCDVNKQHEDKSAPLVPLIEQKLDKEEKISESDSIKGKSKEKDKNISNHKFQKKKLQNKLTSTNKRLKSNSTQNTNSENTDTESEKIDERTCRTNRKEKISKSTSVKVEISTDSDSDSQEINYDILNHKSSEIDSSDEGVTRNKTSNSESKEKIQTILYQNSQKITSQVKSKSRSAKSVNSKNSKLTPKKIDKSDINMKFQKSNSQDVSDSECKSPKSKSPKRKLRNSELDTIMYDVTNEEFFDSELGEIKKEKLSIFDTLFNEAKGSETSEASDFILTFDDEEEEIGMKQVVNKEKEVYKEESEEEIEYFNKPEIDSEDDDIEIGKIDHLNRTNYMPKREELMRIKEMHIKLQHSVPPQHRIEKNSGTRNLSKAEKEDFQKYIKLREGTFTIDEDSILKKNWKTFCKLHNWNVNNPKPFLHMRYKNKEFFLKRRQERMKFVQFLSNGLFDRSLYSVYHRFKILYDPHKVIRYKPYEDDIILNFVRDNATRMDSTFIKRDRKFADLALILKRTRASVWRRYQVLLKKQNKQKENTKIKFRKHVDIDDLSN